jgi:transposase InsO family protein
MQVRLHKNSRTTLAIRQEIRNSPLSAYALAKKYGIAWETANKWKKAESLEDKSSRPNKLNTTLTPEQEELICFERKQFKKTIEDIFFTLETRIPNLYPMKIYRCLKRHDLATLPDAFLVIERKIKKFRKYGIGYLHIDLLYAPKINKVRSYIYTAIDRVGKVAYLMLGKRKNKETGARFLKEVIRFYPYKINYLLTDNGFEFSYKALPKNKKTKKIHPFDKICQENKIQHRTIKFKHPWTNGMVENFNKRVKKQVLTKYLFQSIFDLNGKLLDFVDDYNQHKRLKSLNYKTPAQYLKETKGITLQRIVS